MPWFWISEFNLRPDVNESLPRCEQVIKWNQWPGRMAGKGEFLVSVSACFPEPVFPQTRDTLISKVGGIS